MNNKYHTFTITIQMVLEINPPNFDWCEIGEFECKQLNDDGTCKAFPTATLEVNGITGYYKRCAGCILQESAYKAKQKRKKNRDNR